nr:DUF5455 family protein [Plesiomonas shigelloides]
MPTILARIGAWLTRFIGLPAALEIGKLTQIGMLFTFLLGIFLAFVATITGQLNGLAVSLPADSNLRAGMSLLPSNIPVCMSAIATAHVAAFTYSIKMKFGKLLKRS